jgi:glycosyltransferase 2 family protein
MPVALFLALCNYGIRAIRWHWYLHALKIPLPLRDNFPIFLIGLMLSVTPGKAGELLKAYLVKLSCGVSIARAAPVVVVERLTDMTGMLILATLGLISIRVRGELVFALWGLMAVGLILLSNRRVMHGCIGLARSVLSKRMAGRLERAYESLAELLSARYLLGGTLLSAVAWFAECVSLLVILHGFGTNAGWIESTFIYSLSTLAGAALFFMPGGIGGTEAAMVALLREVVGASDAVASLATVLTRAATLWFAVGIGLTALFFCPLELSDDLNGELQDGTAEP